jgi:hypothetical protein
MPRATSRELSTGTQRFGERGRDDLQRLASRGQPGCHGLPIILRQRLALAAAHITLDRGDPIEERVEAPQGRPQVELARTEWRVYLIARRS